MRLRPPLSASLPAAPPALSPARHALIGGALAVLVIGSWTVLHLAVLFGLPAFPAAGWLALVLVPLLCWLSLGLFIVGHDAMHATLTPGAPRLNRALGTIAAALYANFRYRDLHASHMCHHASPGSEADPDFHAAGPVRFWPWYIAFMRRYFGWRELALMAARVALYLLLGAPLLNILVYYAAPALLSSVQLFYFGTYRPHRHEADDFGDRHNARSSGYPVWLSLLTCFHFGYHHEHHLSPGTPWWRLPGLRS